MLIKDFVKNLRNQNFKEELLRNLAEYIKRYNIQTSNKNCVEFKKMLNDYYESEIDANIKKNIKRIKGF